MLRLMENVRRETSIASAMQRKYREASTEHGLIQEDQKDTESKMQQGCRTAPCLLPGVPKEFLEVAPHS